MRFTVTFLALIFILAVAAPPLAGQTMPRLSSVDPMQAKAGDAITAAGENIGKATVAELYLTDGQKDYKVVMTEQTDTAIKFAVPAKTPAGKYRLMVLTRGKEPTMMVQPVVLTIE
jgi:hypothetical protein